ncbi:MAG TPA: VWA domain-containing protein [Bryobacteraceae bacterium]|nr:VWA domain-containing protein [Bryobacteraceae bacterium]
MIARSTACLLLCSIVPGHAAAQNNSAPLQPEIASTRSPATFTSGVNLVSVPVVVRDAKGRAVGNLRQEDFRLFDKGKQQVIVRFEVQHYALPAGSGPAAGAKTAPAPLAPSDTASDTGGALLPDRYVAYIFDDIHLTFEDLARVREAAEKHFAETLDPHSRAAIFTTSGRVFLDFTNDRDKLHEALRRITVGPSAAPVAPREFELGHRNPCPPNVSYYQADLVLNAQDQQQLNAVEAAAVACYGPDPGPPALGMAVATEVAGAGRVDTQNSLSSLSELVRRISAMPGRRSIVLLSPGFIVPRELRLQESSLMDSAIRSKVSVSGLDARGLYTQQSREAAVLRDTLKDLADGTGGRAFYNDNSFQEGLRLLAAPPEFTYILAFSPQNLKYDGSYHTLRVALENSKGLDVQARHGYWAPNHAADAAEQSKEEIREAVFSLDEVRDIPVDVTTDFFKTGDVTAQLTISSHLDLAGLKFRAAGDRNIDTLTVVTGLFDQDGHYVKGLQRVIDLRLRAQTLDQLVRRGLPVQETFDIASGRYVVRVVVRDSEGSTMAARNGTVNIP